MTLSETHITEKIDEWDTELLLYDQYVTMSNSPRTVGVTLYFKTQWKVNRIKENVMDIGLAHIWRNVKTYYL